MPSAPKRTMLENCGSSLTVVGSMGGANLASSSFTRSRNLAISLSVSVGSVVISGGGAAAFLAALLLVLLIVQCTSHKVRSRCGCCVHLSRAPCCYFSPATSSSRRTSVPSSVFACLLVPYTPLAKLIATPGQLSTEGSTRPDGRVADGSNPLPTRPISHTSSRQSSSFSAGRQRREPRSCRE